MMGIANETAWRKANGVRTILPHDPLVRHHAWSDDPARDRALRLAEDGVAERKTLEECIAGVFPSKPREIGNELAERLQRFTDKMLSVEIEMPTGRPSMITKSVSASSDGEPVANNPDNPESSAEPVAFAIHWGGEDHIDEDNVYLKRCDAQFQIESVGDLAFIVPLFAAPPQPRWWLTEEEVWALRVAADNIPGMEDADGEPLDELEIVFRKLLARNSPPEVVLPDYLRFQFHGQVNRDVRAALAAAGVEVK